MLVLEETKLKIKMCFVMIPNATQLFTAKQRGRGINIKLGLFVAALKHDIAPSPKTIIAL